MGQGCDLHGIVREDPSEIVRSGERPEGSEDRATRCLGQDVLSRGPPGQQLWWSKSGLIRCGWRPRGCLGVGQGRGEGSLRRSRGTRLCGPVGATVRIWLSFSVKREPVTE